VVNVSVSWQERSFHLAVSGGYPIDWKTFEKPIISGNKTCRGRRDILQGPRLSMHYWRQVMAQSPKIAVIGSGLGGFGAAHRLRSQGLEPVLYEKNPYHGGHAASHHLDGFIFDEGPHVSFTADEQVRQLFARSVHDRYEIVHAEVNNYWKGYWIRHPVITSLYGLPPELIVNVLRDFVEKPNTAPGDLRNYEEWLIACYGRTYAETFPMQYTKKYHTTTADNMSTEWVGPRLYQAELEEAILGAVSKDTPNIHYVQEYRYPAQNGFVSFLDLFKEHSNILLNYRIEKVVPKAKELHFRHGVVVTYDHLISSVPLPELVPMIEGVPDGVVEASRSLACTNLVLVNVGVARPDVSSASWSYFYDDDMPFSRISFPRTFSSSTVPDGASSIQCELYFSRKYRPLDRSPEEFIDPVIDGLRGCGLIREDDRIIHRSTMHIPYANIIFDLDRAGALRTVHGYLDDLGIAHCGRYGDWGYLWTDTSFMSGESAAQRILDKITT
jgi:protoporphyrinogen oxidase